jgi:hypothetical protein
MRVNQILLYELVVELDLPDGQYAVFGDAALAAHDLMSADEIDLLVTPELFDELRERGWTAIHPLDGAVLRSDGVTARKATGAPHHLSTRHMIATANRVGGLPVVDLAMLREHVAAQPVSDATLLRLRLIDRELGVVVGSRVGDSTTRSRSTSGWAHVGGVLRAPSSTFEADRGSSLWATAYAVGCVAVLLSTLADVVHGAPSYVVVRTPITAGVALLMQRLITGVARRVCGGYPELAGPTASQAAIVTSLTTVPVAVVDVLPVPLLTLAVAVAMLAADFWLIGLLYSAAFDCSVGRGVVGEIVGVVFAFAVVFAVVFLLAVGLGGCAASG